jgi:hypothetical protein
MRDEAGVTTFDSFSILALRVELSGIDATLLFDRGAANREHGLRD